VSFSLSLAIVISWLLEKTIFLTAGKDMISLDVMLLIKKVELVAGTNQLTASFVGISFSKGPGEVASLFHVENLESL
jgi:hypothetical protein